MKLAFLIGWVALTLSAAGAEDTAPAVPGMHDTEAMALLQSMDHIMPPGKISLGKLRPGLVVEKQDGLNWQEALATADQRFAKDADSAVRRVLFLRKYLKRGMPESCLDDLKLRDLGLSTISGSARTRSLVIGSVDRPVARLHFSIAHGDKTLIAEPVLEVIYQPHIFVLDSATFDSEDRLTGWRMRQPRSDPTDGLGKVLTLSTFSTLPYYSKFQFWKPRQTVFEYGANLSGTDGSPYFWVVIRYADGLWESVSFADPRSIKDRRVTGRPHMAMVSGQPGVQTSHDLDYQEVYENGRLRKRLHHGQRQDEHGTVSVVVLLPQK